MRESNEPKSIKKVKGVKVIKKTQSHQIRGGVADIVIIDVEGGG